MSTVAWTSSNTTFTWYGSTIEPRMKSFYCPACQMLYFMPEDQLLDAKRDHVIACRISEYLEECVIFEVDILTGEIT